MRRSIASLQLQTVRFSKHSSTHPCDMMDIQCVQDVGLVIWYSGVEVQGRQHVRGSLSGRASAQGTA